jgi:hypothetical protein
MSDETNEALPDDFTSQVEPTPPGDTPEPEKKDEEPKKPEEKDRTITVP